MTGGIESNVWARIRYRKHLHIVFADNDVKKKLKEQGTAMAATERQGMRGGNPGCLDTLKT